MVIISRLVIDDDDGNGIKSSSSNNKVKIDNNCSNNGKDKIMGGMQTMWIKYNNC